MTAQPSKANASHRLAALNQPSDALCGSLDLIGWCQSSRPVVLSADWTTFIPAQPIKFWHHAPSPTNYPDPATLNGTSKASLFEFWATMPLCPGVGPNEAFVRPQVDWPCTCLKKTAVLLQTVLQLAYVLSSSPPKILNRWSVVFLLCSPSLCSCFLLMR
jgi:hypothetical protein